MVKIDKLKTICRGVAPDVLPAHLHSSLNNLTYNSFDSMPTYASARMESDTLVVTLFFPIRTYSGTKDSVSYYDFVQNGEKRVILYFADGHYLYKDVDGTMRIDDGLYFSQNKGGLSWLCGTDCVREALGSDAPEGELGMVLHREIKKRREARILNMHKKETDAIDAYMNVVPELPKDMDRFIRNVVTKDSRYIYYKKGKDKEAYCTHCRQDVPLDVKKAYHNAPGRCPNCGSKIKYKAKGKSTLVSDNYAFCVMQKTSKGLVCRYFELNINFKDHYKNPEIHYFEIARDFTEIESKREFEYGLFKQNYSRWCVSTGNWNYHKSNAFLYTRNLKRVLKDTPLKYSALYEFASSYNGPFNLDNYISQYRDFRGLEYIVKLGLVNLAKDLIDGYRGYVNRYGKSPLEILRLPKHLINQAVRIDASIHIHGNMVNLADRGIFLDDGELKWIGHNLGGAVGLAEVLGHTTFRKFKSYMINQQPYFAKGMKLQGGIVPDDSSGYIDIFQYYMDYLYMAKKLNRDLASSQVIFPRDIVRAHDEAVQMVEIYKRRKEEHIFASIPKKYKHLEYADKNLLIKLPATVKEVVEEGQALRHCVGNSNYIEKMTEEKSLILFIRKVKAPGISYYTVELDPHTNEVIQCRGKSNCNKSKDVEKFLNKYIRKLKRVANEIANNKMLVTAV